MRGRALATALALTILCISFFGNAPARAAAPPTVTAVMEGREPISGRVVLMIVGNKVSALKTGSIARDGNEIGPIELIAKGKTIQSYRLPEAITEPGAYSVTLFYGPKRAPRPITVDVDISLGQLWRLQDIEPDARTELDDAETFGGHDPLWYADAANLTTGTLGIGRFSALDDLNDEGAIGSGAGQVAAGDHDHDDRYFTETETSSPGTLNDPGNPVDWSRIKNVPAGFADGSDDGAANAGEGITVVGATISAAWAGSAGDFGTTTNVARSDHTHDGRYFTETELSSTGVVNTAGNPVDWTRLKGMPGDFADGIDDDTDTTYTAGAGLSLASQQFSVSFAGSGSASSASRSDHDHATLYTYTAGDGLSLAGTQFSVSFGGTGGTTLAARSDHLHDTRYRTQTELGNGGAINVSTNPVDWTKLKNVPGGLADGLDADTTYTAGTGLQLSGTQFTTLFGGNGAATTSSRSDHDHDSAYRTQSELSAVGAINTGANPVDWTKLKSVPAGIADGTDADTTYSAGDGLSLSTGVFSVSFGGSGVATDASRSDHTHGGGFVAKTGDTMSGKLTISVTAGDAMGSTTSASGGAGVRGENTHSVSAGYGVLGVHTSSIRGIGVRGEGTDGGVEGEASRLDGIGVFGLCTGTGGGATSPTGVRGEASATSSAVGVAGEATATAGAGIGVSGESRGPTGTGVFGRTWDTISVNYGVRGLCQSPVGFGVHAQNSSLGGTAIKGDGPSQGIGVDGRATSSLGIGVFGRAATGVKGETTTTTGFAVHGVTSNRFGAGVAGETSNGDSGATGVKGIATATTMSGMVNGVHGTAVGFRGRGVLGTATSTTGSTEGVRGEVASTGGRGVFGLATATTGGAHGVWGETASNQGRAVYGNATATTGTTIGVIGDSFSNAGRGVAAVARGTLTGSVALQANHASTVGSGRITEFLNNGVLRAEWELDGGATFYGTISTGTIPTTGQGTRMMWYPAKAAFRAGYVHSGASTSWDDSNVGTYSHALGYSARASGDYSVALGDRTIASGARSLAHGDQNTASGDIATALGRMTTAASYAELVIGRFNTLPSVTAGSWSSSDPLFVAGNGASTASRSNAATIFKDGNMTIGGTLTQNSDARLKKDVAQLDGVLQKLEKVRGVEYAFKDQKAHPRGRQIGLLAQEVRDAFPELVREDDAGTLSVSYGNFTAVLLQAVKEQQERIDALERRLQKLDPTHGVAASRKPVR